MLAIPWVKTIVLVALVYLVSFIIPLLLGRKRVELVAPAVALLGVAFQLVANRGERLGQLGLRLSTPDIYLQALLVVGGILLGVLAVGYASGKLRLRQEMNRSEYARFIVNVLLQTVQNGVVAIGTEELVFRGLVQRQLSQSISPIAAILIAAAIFGIWHAPLGRLSLGLSNRQVALYAAGTGLAGALFGAFYHLSQSLLVAGFAHGLWNGIVYPVWGLGEAFPSLLASEAETLTHPEYGVAGVLALAVAVPLLLVLVL
jgi:membrane protease YdiL (CAAX protease family)